MDIDGQEVHPCGLLSRGHRSRGKQRCGWLSGLVCGEAGARGGVKIWVVVREAAAIVVCGGRTSAPVA